MSKLSFRCFCQVWRVLHSSPWWKLVFTFGKLVSRCTKYIDPRGIPGYQWLLDGKTRSTRIEWLCELATGKWNPLSANDQMIINKDRFGWIYETAVGIRRNETTARTKSRITTPSESAPRHSPQSHHHWPPVSRSSIHHESLNGFNKALLVLCFCFLL